MEIATREIEMLTTIYYNDGCTKKIKIDEIYTGYTMTPMFRYKIVRFILPDGTIDDDRSYDSRLFIDKSEEFDTEYTNLDVQMLTTIYYNDGCAKTIHIHKDHKYIMTEFTFRYPDNTIDDDRSCSLTNSNDRGGESSVNKIIIFETFYDIFKI